MGSPLHTCQFVRLLFSLRAADCLNPPEYKGSALRGGFGHAFRFENSSFCRHQHFIWSRPSVNLEPKKEDSLQRAQRKFEVKQGNTPFSLLYSVHSLSDNNRIFWLTYLLHESTEKKLILFCILNMKLFFAFSVV